MEQREFGACVPNSLPSYKDPLGLADAFIYWARADADSLLGMLV
jgi:hypothetical protein